MSSFVRADAAPPPWAAPPASVLLRPDADRATVVSGAPEAGARLWNRRLGARLGRTTVLEPRLGDAGSWSVEVDAGEPEAWGVDLSRGGQGALGLPQAGEAVFAGALKYAPDECGAAGVLRLAEL